MSAPPEEAFHDGLPPRIAYMFAPIDKRALGIAFGVVAGTGIALLTAAYLVVRPTLPLSLLAHYFPGYSVSWGGLWVGLLWGLGVGYCAGWLLAFTRNMVIASWIFLTRGRAELGAARDFLDHL